MHPFTDAAAVVRTYDYREADRIVTFLTARHGVVRAVARGVRRTRSRFGASLEPFAFVQVELAPGRGGPHGPGLGQVREVVSTESLAPAIVSDYPSFTAGCVVLETAERLAGDDGAPAPRLLTLAHGACRSLAERRRDPALVVDAFTLRAMAAAGWEPELRACCRCGAVGPHRAFHIPSGGTVCVHCRPPGAQSLAPGVVDHLTALLEGDWAGAAHSGPAVVRTASGIAAAHLRWHLERDLRSLPHLDRTHPTSRPVTPGRPHPVEDTDARSAQVS